MNQVSKKTRCYECGDRERPRGKWSRYFCEPCDLERMKRVDAGMEKIARELGIPFSPMPERLSDGSVR